MSTDDDLPPLPPPMHYGGFATAYTEAQMRAYARAAVQQDRARRGEPEVWRYRYHPNGQWFYTRHRPSNPDVMSEPLYAAPPQPAVEASAEPSMAIVGTLIRHALAGDVEKVRAYGGLLCDDMDKRQPGSAKYLRRIVAGDFGEVVHLADAPPQPAEPSEEQVEAAWQVLFGNTLNAEEGKRVRAALVAAMGARS